MMRSVMRIWQADGRPGGSGSGSQESSGSLEDLPTTELRVGGGRPRTRQRHARGCRRGTSDLAESKRKRGQGREAASRRGLEGECGFSGSGAGCDSVARNGQAEGNGVRCGGDRSRRDGERGALSSGRNAACRVLGIERFEPGHDRGSSHGLTRIIRLGYFEHPSYVPLVRRAYALWRELEAASGETLLTVTGIAEMGLPDSALVAGTLASSRLHDLPHEVLDARALMQRLPAIPAAGGFRRRHPARWRISRAGKSDPRAARARQGRRRGDPHRRNGARRSSRRAAACA